MGILVPFDVQQICRHRLNNLSNQPLGRFSEFLATYTIQPQYYVRSANARLVSLIGIEAHHRLIHETTPFLRLGGRARLRLALRSLLPPGERVDEALCPMMDHRGWHREFFHWFLDFLPRIFAAEHHREHTGQPFVLLLPERLTTWQDASLHRLGYGGASAERKGPRGQIGNIRASCLISASSHRHQHDTGAPFDAISPVTLKRLRQRLGAAPKRGGGSELPRRILISRARASSRRILNEDQILSWLEVHGFRSVEPESMTLDEQIELFSNATHVIAVHGAGMTNLIHACHAAVLELFSDNHGIRPDYFQICCILELPYFYAVCRSVGERNDIHLDRQTITDFLDATL